MNIVMFTDSFAPRVNGVGISVISFAKELDKIGHKVCIVCPDYESNHLDAENNITHFKHFFYEKNDDTNSNLKILRIPSDQLVVSKEDRAVRLNQWRKIKHELDPLKPDLVHINSEFVMGWYGVTYARHAHIPIVYTFHTMWEDYFENYLKMVPASFSQKLGRDVVRFYLKRADSIIAPTERIKQVVARYEISSEVNVLPTGISSDIYKYDEKTFKNYSKQIFKKFPKLAKKDILLYVGRIVREKNLDFLFSVFEKVEKTNPNTALLFVGGGPGLEELEEEVKSKSFGDKIFFTGYQPRESLIYFYKLSKIFVFPSLTETQGLVTLEAMLGGLPVVAIGELGTRDVMQGDNGGFMVRNDAQEFADRVVQLLNDPVLYEEKVNEALAWGDKWSISTLTPKLVEIYKKSIEIKSKRKSDYSKNR